MLGVVLAGSPGRAEQQQQCGAYVRAALGWWSVWSTGRRSPLRTGSWSCTGDSGFRERFVRSNNRVWLSWTSRTSAGSVQLMEKHLRKFVIQLSDPQFHSDLQRRPEERHGASAILSQTSDRHTQPRLQTTTSYTRVVFRSVFIPYWMFSTCHTPRGQRSAKLTANQIASNLRRFICLDQRCFLMYLEK